MAGFVFNALGHRPRPGDAVAIGAVRLAVERMDGMRIARLRIELGSTPPAGLSGGGRQAIGSGEHKTLRSVPLSPCEAAEGD